MYIQIGLMVLIIYFFMIRPANRKAKQEKDFESGLKVGDKVITKSGMHGKVAELSEGTFVLETMAGKLKMERSAISVELTAKLNTSEVK